jgi:HSP20 family molecular chaperone IbpA
LTAPATRPVWEPPIDVSPTTSQVRVIVALPGARAEDVNVQLTPAGLQIDTTWHRPPPA